MQAGPEAVREALAKPAFDPPSWDGNDLFRHRVSQGLGEQFAEGIGEVVRTG